MAAGSTKVFLGKDSGTNSDRPELAMLIHPSEDGASHQRTFSIRFVDAVKPEARD
jgi:hypothetical protein